MRLRVRQLKQKDPGSGMAVIDRSVLGNLGVGSGDFVRLIGPDGGDAIARVWPSSAADAEAGIVRIDGQLREEAGASIDDTVDIEPIDVEAAREVTVALPDRLRIRGDVGPYLREQLTDHAVRPGQTIGVSFGLRTTAGRTGRVPIRIADTTPSAPVVIRPDTTVTVADRAAEEIEVSGTDDAGRLPTGVTYEDIGGLDDELEQVREMIELPMRHPELFRTLGVEPPKGVLLHGPPGTGKTLIAQAVANEIDADFLTISGPEIMSKYYGESEEQLREVFEEAADQEPAIVFIDELDSIAPKREDVSGDVERRVVAQLLSLMDGLDERGAVTVIATTNRIDAVDPALRRPGRFDREIEIGVPDREDRLEILRIHTRGMPLADDVDLDRHADTTYGFVGADLENLAREAGMQALRRIRPDLELDREELDASVLDAIEVSGDDVKAARRGIESSALREVFVEVPDVTGDDVGGLENAKATLRETVQWPLEHAAAYDHVGLKPATGVLLHGPPGTGKTLLAKAVANEADSNFISIKGPELLDKYVGESKRGVREIFKKARENAPTVVFFDEIDAIAAERGSGAGDTNVGERVVSQLLTELDGLESLEDVVVIATTNRPDLIDDALIRPGRLDRHVEVGTPDEAARREIFSIHTRDQPLADDVDLDDLAGRTDSYVGADIEALCREAATAAVREHVAAGADPESIPSIEVTMDHFEADLESGDGNGGDETVAVSK